MFAAESIIHFANITLINIWPSCSTCDILTWVKIIILSLFLNLDFNTKLWFGRKLHIFCIFRFPQQMWCLFIMQQNHMFIYFIICCGYSLEACNWGVSNEHYKKNIDTFGKKKHTKNSFSRTMCTLFMVWKRKYQKSQIYINFDLSQHFIHEVETSLQTYGKAFLYPFWWV